MNDMGTPKLVGEARSTGTTLGPPFHKGAGPWLEWRPAPRLTAQAATKPMATATAVTRERGI